MWWEEGAKRTHLRCGGNIQEVNETNVLIPDDFDLVDKTEAAQIIPKHLLRHSFVEASEIDVAAGVALLDALQNLAGNWACLAPTDLQFVAVKSDFLDGGVSVECSGRCAVEEGDEDAGLFGEDTNGLDWAEMDQVEELVD